MENVYILKEDLNKWVGKYFTKDLVSVDDLLRVIEDLDEQIETLKEQIEDIKQDRDDNYRPISYYKQYAISEDQFH